MNNEYMNLLPVGAIIMWYGGADEVPYGWAICNGKNSTPDLRNKFIVGAGHKYDLKEEGGSESVTLDSKHLPPHSHKVTGSIESSGYHKHRIQGNTNTDGNHQHKWYGYKNVKHDGDGAQVRSRYSINSDDWDVVTKDTEASKHNHKIDFYSQSSGSHTHNFNLKTENIGSGYSHENRPPYYALYYIMRVDV